MQTMALTAQEPGPGSAGTSAGVDRMTGMAMGWIGAPEAVDKIYQPSVFGGWIATLVPVVKVVKESA